MDALQRIIYSCATSCAAMIVTGAAGHELHLGYCTNIHAGETWDEVRAIVATHVRAVKTRVAPDRPMGVGLRLSAEAARGLSDPTALAAFRAELAAAGLYVFTINGFPYGAFSGTTVKERVYRPDWLEDDRLAYHDTLAGLLAALLPDGRPELEGSVSTVPGCFEERGARNEVGPRVAERLRLHVARLLRLRARTGRVVTLALEPEPHCVLETTADAVAFFEEHLFSRASVTDFALTTGLAAPEAEAALRLHLGVCLDACHAAVEFETPDEAIDRLRAAGIRILKVQVSAGLRVAPPDAEARAALVPFAEGVYLHQVVSRHGAHLRRTLDLPLALADAARAVATAAPEDAGRGHDQGHDEDEWRVHFHVPIFMETFGERLGAFTGTQSFLVPLLARLARENICQHLEVETYTWDVLPPEHRQAPVDEVIARELEWTLERLRAS